jgi:type IV secretion system protein VirD4
LTDTKELEPEAAEGLNGLYRRYAGWLDGRLRAHVDADQAADVVQETYLRAAPYRSADIRHPKSFLLRIALNLVRDESRRLKRQHEALGDCGQEQSGAASQAEQLMLKQIILTMPPLYRDIFVLSRFGGMTYPEIAAARGLSVKGVGVVIPNLLAWPGSTVVLDIKRENFAATAGYRAEAGQRVLLFDPLAADGRTARFNPLDHIDRTDSVAVLDELQRMASMLFVGSEHSDPFWSEAARTGFIGVGAFVAETPTLPFTLGEMFRQLTQADPRVRFPGLIRCRRDEGSPLSSGCVSALSDFCSSSENTFASIRQTITTRMGLWLNPAVDAATSTSDFDLRDLRRGRISLYLGSSPDNMLRVAPLYGLLFQQLIDLNSRTLPGPSDRPVLVLLDEFARLGPAPVLAHAFAWAAGYGLRLLPVIQSPAQLRALYGPDVTEEILTNCGLEIVFAPKELKVAQDLSERLGYYTYRARSRSRPSGLAAGRRSLTDSDQRRALMLPQELMQMPADRLIVLKAGLPPIRARKIVYYRERAFVDRLRPAPVVSPRPRSVTPPPSSLAEPELDFDSLALALAAEGLAPPPADASEGAFGDWVDRMIDTAAPPAADLVEARDR